VRGNGG
jgi:hypothetical protein